MHWVMFLIKAWLLCGIVTVIVAIIWTSRESAHLKTEAASSHTVPKRQPEFRAAKLPEARSA
jgi:hypothetical protein